jgi:hypothetical protein
VTLSDNRVAGDIINDHYTTASFATSAVGIGITVNVSGITIDGANASYYILGNTTATTTANIFGIGTTTVITNAAELATPTLAGHSYPVSFSVTPDISGTLSGNVTVSDGTGATCNVSVTGTVASGTCDLTSTTVGIKSLTATFVSDDPNYGGSTSNPVLHTVYLIFRIYLPLVIRP